MYSLLETALTNVLLATALAVVAALVGRAMHRPALTHALWVLVLLKLLTPPVLEVPVGLSLRMLPVAGESRSDGETNKLPSPTLSVFPSPHPRLSPHAKRSDTATPPPAGHQTLQDRVGTSLPKEAGAASAPAVAAATGGPSDTAGRSGTSPMGLHSGENPTERGKPPGPSSLPDARSIGEASAARAARLWTSVAAGVWLAGSLICLTLRGVGLLRFWRYLHRAQPAPAGLQDQLRALSGTMRLRRCPDLLVVPGSVSPMLWGLPPKILFPERLLQRLSRSSRQALLAHELAHSARGDCWVRLLELLATGVYWWCPIVWWARRELETAEEVCCDAWVVEWSPATARCYAEALLDTVDFLSESPAALPSLASGIGNGQDLRCRLRQIMQGPPPEKLSRISRLLVAAAAVFLLPLQPGAAKMSDPGSPMRDQSSETKSFPLSSLVPHPPQTGTPPGQSHRLADPLDNRSKGGPDEESPANLPDIEVWAAAKAPVGQTRILARTDGGIRLENTATAQSIDLSAYRITSVAFSPDGRLFVSGGLDGAVRLWDARTGRLITVLGSHEAPVRSVAYAPEGGRAVSGGDDGRVILWHIEQRHKVAALPQQDLPIACVRFSPQGDRLAVATGDWQSATPGSVTLWDVTSLTRTSNFPSRSAVGAVAFREDGGRLLVGEWDGRVTAWDLETGRRAATAFVAKDIISATAFSTDTKRLADLDVDQLAQLRTPKTSHLPLPQPQPFRAMDALFNMFQPAQDPELLRTPTTSSGIRETVR